MKSLIIGKNSKIVKSLEPYLKLVDIDYISHEDIESIESAIYSVIFLFSWDFKDIGSNLRMIKCLPIEKIVFISSMAVRSLEIRPQWAAYPNNKKICEDLVISGGGSVLRIGVIENSGLKLNGMIPVTRFESLAISIRELIKNPSGNKVYECYALEAQTLGFIRRFCIKLVNGFSRKHSQILSIQYGAYFLLRTLGIDQRSYTSDLVWRYRPLIQIGWGAIGSKYKSKLEVSTNFRSVIYSWKPNVILQENGFKLTRIGKYGTGLAAFWHGAYIAKIKGKYFKRVPLFPYRPKLPKSAYAFDVISIDFFDGLFEIYGCDENNQKYSLFAPKLILAAGALENIRLLSQWRSCSTVLSEHEIGRLGSVSLETVKKIFDPEIKLGFLFNRQILKFKEDTKSKVLEFYVEVRPSLKTYPLDQKTFYMQQTKSILFKLLTQFSFRRINEAIYNKFGFSVLVESWDVYVQVLNKDCICFDASYGFTKKALNIKDIELVKNTLSKRFNKIKFLDKINFVEAQHIHGGADMLNNSLISELMLSGQLTIVGSPSILPLGAFHHTRHLQELYENKDSDLQAEL